MKNLQFKCTLLSDVIINQKAATEGNQQTLDFIPGNAFLGVAAGGLYKEDADKPLMFTLFHSGKVCFGDAHPLFEEQRAIRIPASWYYRKVDSDKSTLFVHHGMPDEGLKEKGNPIQIKQCRDGFIAKKGENSFSEIKMNKHFAIKSAYDSAKRRSEDQKMYGYESLEAGSEWCFEVTLDHDAEQYEELINNALVGKKRVGRSSTAQYGLVEIEKSSFKASFKTEKPIQVKLGDNDRTENEVLALLLYAESRLIFNDQYGQPTFTPTEKQLGLEKGKIDWTKSQIRTFQYAPYNNHRKTRDADRCGIEKGSVFCITGATFDDIEKAKTERGIGNCLNEGFGKVLVNPEFLAYKIEDKINGVAVFIVDKETDKTAIIKSENRVIALLSDTSDSLVFKYLENRQAEKKKQNTIYELVNKFVTEKSNNFRGDTFASQWGTIRSIAMKVKTETELKEKLYDKPDGYLVHGVAKDKWNERRRLEDLKGFISTFCGEKNKTNAAEAVINLAAEMAKKCKKEDNR